MTKSIDFCRALGLPALPSYGSDTIAALLWARDVMQKHTSSTYGVQDPKGVDELKKVKIGGVDQWFHIRGRNRNNPVLLYLHGGPGSPMIGDMDAIQRPWEDYFTVVMWDQRQTGKSYYAAGDDSPELSIDIFITDAEEAIEYLRSYLQKDKLFLVGHSWGSVIGIHLANSQADRLYAYIGIGQVVNSLEAEKLTYQRLIHHAKSKGDSDLETKLEDLIRNLESDFPHREKSFVENSTYVRRELSNIAGESLMHHLSWDRAIEMFSLNRLTSPHLDLTDITNALLGDPVAVYRPPYAFTKQFLEIDLPSQVGSSFQIPIFFFTGVHDWQTPVQLSDDWFGAIKAPYKELIHFDESSHAIINEEPGKFLISLVSNVLPFSESANSV